jgi:outer membrane receptor protein involved in Fe transport
MTRNCLIRRAVRIALAAAASSSVVVPAFAQDQQAGATESSRMDEITVVGSRIIRPDYEATSPVVTVNEDVFKLSGEPQIETVLNTLPQLVPSVTTTSNNPSNSGQANVDLRGLGTTRTLVLVDGARTTPSNVSGVVDLNTIPAALIEGVEILTGGSSATYGSDAIAGVVNVRLKRDFNGVEIRAQQGLTGESDGKTTVFDVLIGGNFGDERGNAVLAFSYDRRDALLAGEREFGLFAKGPLDLRPSGSSTIPEGSVSFGTNGPSQGALDQVFAGYGVAAGSVNPTRTISFNPDGSLFSMGGGGLAVQNFEGNTDDPGYNPASYSYNFGPLNYLQLPLARRQIAAFGRYSLVEDVAEVYSRVSFTTYSSDQQLAATPITCSGTQLGCTVPVTNTAIPTDLRTLLESRVVNPMAPTTTGPASNFTVFKRTTDVGERYQENSHDVTFGLVGVRGQLPNDWHWDVYGSWGQGKSLQLQAGNVSRQRYQSALNNAAVFAGQGCASFNPFGVGNLTEACAAAVEIVTTNLLTTEQRNAVASLTGDIVDLPAGSLQFAAGAEYRENTADFRPDSYLSSGDVVGFNAAAAIQGKIASKEYFAELSVPLLKDIPVIDYLGLELGYRMSDYATAGTIDTYKAALKWDPVESVSIRGSYNRAIRAPNILELLQPQSEGFPAYSDPCNANSSFRTGSSAAQVVGLCQAQGIPANFLATFAQPNPQARAISGGNPDLDPETADTYTFGVVWDSNLESEWANNLQVSLDYFKYDITDVIASLSSSSIIGRCFNQLNGNPTFDPNNQFCQLFSRDSNTLGVSGVQTTTLNLAAMRLDGVDLQVDWKMPLSAFGLSENAGSLGFKILATRLLSWEQQETAADPFIPREGTISQTIASAFPEWKAVMTTSYAKDNFLLRYNLRWIDNMDVVNNDAVLSPATLGYKPWVPNYFYHDITAQWAPNDTWELTLGINNIADKAPPTYTTNSQTGVQSNTDPSTYDVLGRRAFLTVAMKF